MTRLPLSSSANTLLPSGGVDTQMPAAAYCANGNTSSILSPPSSSKSMSGTSLSPLPPHLAADSSFPISNASPSFAAALSSPSLKSPAGPSARQSSAFLPTSSNLYFPELSSIEALGNPVSPQSFLAPGLDTTSILSRSVSVDGAAQQQQSSVLLVQRLAQQNALIREAWEAERNYLEANRRRAEEVYQEERAIMEDVRDSWNLEKGDLQRELQALRERIQRLEGENSALKAVAAQSVQINGVLSPLSSLRGGDSVDSSADSPSYFSIVPGVGASVAAQHMVPRGHGGVASPDANISLPLGLDASSRRPHKANSGAQRTSPPNMVPATASIIDPRTQPEVSTPRDFLATTEETGEPVPVIDVQQIDPKLEGISLKASAVQKPTFSEHSQSSPLAPQPAKTEPHNKLLKSTFGKRTSSKEHTMKALAAEESHRLTMHAGHTPNHSLSLFPTMTTATETNTATGRSEGTTPTASSAPPERHDAEAAEPSNDLTDEVPVEKANGRRSQGITEESNIDDGDTLLEPSDDIPLKGPLMVKNIPAQDELFWAALNKKLEPISQGQDALPTVIQTPVVELEVPPLSTVPANGHDAAQDSHNAAHDGADAKEGGKKPMDKDVPLKFKSTSNFGAPFGKM